MSWINSCLNGLLRSTSATEVTATLNTITRQLHLQPGAASEILERFFHPKATDILTCFEKYADNEVLLLDALRCIDDTLNSFSDPTPTTAHLEAQETIGNVVLQLQYTESKLQWLKNPTLFACKSLSILNKIALRCPNYAQSHIAELLGVAKAHVNYGLDTDSLLPRPQKILPRHHTLYDSSAEELECGSEIDFQTRSGKVSKKRKPRALTKSVQSQQQQQTNRRALDLDNIGNVNQNLTSDSDASEAETGAANNAINHNRNIQERYERAKVRLAAIALLGTVVSRVQERRILYGYWHAFFDIANDKNAVEHLRRRSDLFYIGLHDPNVRCRSISLQVAAQLIFDSRNFLQKAECQSDSCPTAFLPFSYTLGLLVLSLFQQLTQILANESSLPVLTQALKCLAVLVQATTPFERFQPRDFVAVFVKEVQRLVEHRDSTIQVAALMVMEFLIATPVLTPEISAAVGIPCKGTSRSKERRLNDDIAANLLELDNSFEEFIECDSDNEVALDTEVDTKTNIQEPCEALAHQTDSISSSSWLLQHVFQNLETSSSSSTVRIESIQIIAAMANHLALLQTQLVNVQLAKALENSLRDPLSDVRICGARSLDTVVYQISRTLLEFASKSVPFDSNSQKLEKECLLFWEHLLPCIMTQIRLPATESTAAVFKISLCDILSNMGVVIFEKQQYCGQMNLIGFLSGIASDPNEEAVVRGAAVRALAVFAMFPSLRGNLVFIENTAELTLHLVADSNLLVRVKALWALGNVSDALLISNDVSTTSTAPSPERISDGLLWRLIAASTEACSDNDKVRCNAVRTLGNLLRLLSKAHLDRGTDSDGKRLLFQNAINKLIDCLRAAGSAKVKWNACYAIGNLLQNAALYNNNQLNTDFDWQSKLYPALAKVIVHHANFKVRINAAAALTRITHRSYYGVYFELFWTALLEAIEQSYHLDNFQEYNHRDNLQEQLCLALCHLIRCASLEDFVVLRKNLEPRLEIVRNTWIRVVNRMVPEKSAPLLSCTSLLQQRIQNKDTGIASDHYRAINFIIKSFETQ